MLQTIQKDKKEGNLIERTYIIEEIRDFTHIFIYIQYYQIGSQYIFKYYSLTYKFNTLSVNIPTEFLNAIFQVSKLT